jgi:hypothetical protein
MFAWPCCYRAVLCSVFNTTNERLKLNWTAATSEISDYGNISDVKAQTYILKINIFKRESTLN